LEYTTAGLFPSFAPERHQTGISIEKAKSIDQKPFA
jgi:hypothetical protein